MPATLTPAAWHTLSLPLNPLLGLGGVLLDGLLGGHWLMRILRVPPATAYVLMGLLLGPAALNLLDRDMLADVQLFIDLAAGMIVFQLGRRIDVRWLLREKRLLASSLLEALCTSAAVAGMLLWLGVNPLAAALAASIALATSPAVLLMAVRDLRAEGQVTERALHLTALNNVLASLAFAVCLTVLERVPGDGALPWLEPLAQVLGAGALGVAAGALMAWLGQRLSAGDSRQWPLLFAVVVLTLGLAQLWTLAPWVALLACGVAARALDRRESLAEPDVQPLGTVFYLLLFVSLGVSLPPQALGQAWLPALALIGARCAGRLLCLTALARLNALSWRKGAALGLAMQPMSGLALLLADQARLVYPALGGPLLTTLLSAWLLLAVLAPLGVQLALRLSGDARP